jgi:hypothetical protein
MKKKEEKKIENMIWERKQQVGSSQQAEFHIGMCVVCYLIGYFGPESENICMKREAQKERKKSFTFDCYLL